MYLMPKVDGSILCAQALVALETMFSDGTGKMLRVRGSHRVCIWFDSPLDLSLKSSEWRCSDNLTNLSCWACRSICFIFYEVSTRAIMKTGYVYILRCVDWSFYTGVTNDVERRLYEHITSNDGSYTSRRKPLKLVWVSHELNIQDAIALEKQIKGWRREKKIALINEEYDRLPELARAYAGRKFPTW